MDWTNLIPASIQYIENHLTEDITVDSVAKEFNVSTFFFQKGFMMLCGYSVSEYIRNRRLTLAGNDLINKENSVTDIAMKYYYDTPDSFTKAFSRFHGATPTAIRKGESTLKTFAPLKMKIVLEGGYLLDYKIVKKEAFDIIGMSRILPYDATGSDINEFWQEMISTDYGSSHFSNYGVSLDFQGEFGNHKYKYLVAQLYDADKDYPDEMEVYTIPDLDWVVFPCVGPEPETLMRVVEQVYSEWLPTLREYDIDGRYLIEYYDDPGKYANDVRDEKYYVELWFPIRKKSEK